MKNRLQIIMLLFVLTSLTACGEDDNDSNATNQLSLEFLTKELSATTSVTDQQGNTYTVSYRQASSDNQNPVVEKKNAQSTQIWKKEYESVAVDGRAILIILEENNIPWVVFSQDGGDTSENSITKKEVESGAFSGVYSNSYQSGGGPKVNVLARLNPETGKITKGTFLIAKLDNGRTNGFGINKLGFKSGKIVFEAGAAAWPPGKGKSYVRFPNLTNDDRYDSFFRLYYEMKTDLSEITEAVNFKK